MSGQSDICILAPSGGAYNLGMALGRERGKRGLLHAFVEYRLWVIALSLAVPAMAAAPAHAQEEPPASAQNGGFFTIMQNGLRHISADAACSCDQTLMIFFD